MLLFTTTIIEKPVEGTDESLLVGNDPRRKAWVWDQREQTRKRSDGKRRVTFNRGKFKFDPPFVFDRLEEIPDRYEIPLLIQGSLAYIDIDYPMDKDLETLPAVFMTADTK